MPLGGGLSLGLATAGLVGKGINYLSVGSDRDKAQKLVDEISKTPLSQYTADPALLQYYSRNLNTANSPQGFTGGEKAAYQNNVATNINTQFKNANNTSGGNLGKFLNNAFTPSVVSGANTFASQDATLRRSNENAALGRLGSSVTALQSLKDKNVAQENQRILMAQQAAGQAVLQDKSFQQQDLEGLSSDLLGGGLMLGLGGGKNPGGFSKLFDSRSKPSFTGYDSRGGYSEEPNAELFNF